MCVREECKSHYRLFSATLTRVMSWNISDFFWLVWKKDLEIFKVLEEWKKTNFNDPVPEVSRDFLFLEIHGFRFDKTIWKSIFIATGIVHKGSPKKLDFGTPPNDSPKSQTLPKVWTSSTNNSTFIPDIFQLLKTAFLA